MRFEPVAAIAQKGQIDEARGLARDFRGLSEDRQRMMQELGEFVDGEARKTVIDEARQQ